ncbi:MAG: hypothetical protein QF619_04570 [Candidatus Binatia bacterium]|jgi:maleate cis-trans isomerase|nr:hypothetical protein [Candidatus Binatia bacterium]
MAETIRRKIGFLSPVSTSSTHFDHFKAFIPGKVDVEFQGLELLRASLYDLKGKDEHIVKSAMEFTAKNGWQGVIVSGGPVEVLNPGLLDQLQAALPVPVTTALNAYKAAIKSYSANRMLLMTLFDEAINKLIRGHLANGGIEAISPPHTAHRYGDAAQLEPEDVYSLT